MRGWRFGVDVGGTKIAVGLVDGEMQLLTSQRLEALSDESAISLIDRLLDALADICRTCGGSAEDVVAVGLGIPGDFDPADRAVRSCPNLPRLVGSHPSQLFAQAFEGRWKRRIPVVADNDTVVAVLAEATRGAGRGQIRLLYLTVSTGVGGARFDGRRPIGEQCVNLEPGLRLKPSVEQPGKCLEELAGGAHLARTARRQLDRWWQDGGAAAVESKTSILRHSELDKGPWADRLQRLSARHLGETAATGDVWCSELFAVASKHVAAGLGLILNQGWGEQRIVVGGSIALRVPGFLNGLRHDLREVQRSLSVENSWRSLDVDHDLVAAELGEERGIFGAVLLASRDRPPPPPSDRG